MNHVRFSNWWYVGLLFTLVACQTPATPTTIPPATLPAPNTLLPAATLAPTANPVGAQTPTAVRATATQTTSNRVFHSADNGSQFRLPMTIAYGTGWAVQHDIKDALTIVHVGDPPEPDSQWWGPDINLVNGALVHEAGDIVSSQSASADKTKFIPWPADFFAYLTSLPGVKVIHRSEPITIGGIQGTQIVLQTPPMHPIIWLKDDTSWMGGGKSVVDPESKRQIVLLEVNGEKVYMAFADSPNKFDEHYPLVQAIFNSITFDK